MTITDLKYYTRPFNLSNAPGCMGDPGRGVNEKAMPATRTTSTPNTSAPAPRVIGPDGNRGTPHPGGPSRRAARPRPIRIEHLRPDTASVRGRSRAALPRRSCSREVFRVECRERRLQADSGSSSPWRRLNSWFT